MLVFYIIPLQFSSCIKSMITVFFQFNTVAILIVTNIIRHLILVRAPATENSAFSVILFS